ncbi:hypothetical protein [Adhaeribacter radiodurans]|uniref:HTTM-like domain-containing protein n=1 Tax=Adhaeribacter radiodurans TaxID=2745197 RepID=A0A7L7LDB3_9BACT|nr:hypothetical protein [Adhaeribacter radiodurans]QMU30684.1 hypothetical protein HUW48_22835 [Adhaeribacter radiodurans]
MHYLLLYLKKVFTVDVRALALMRIGIGFVILLDLGIRATDLEAHYANMGVLPLHVLFQYNWDPYFISLHAISGLWQVQAVLFLIAALFGFLLLIGYRTRLATIVSWFLLLSLQNRNLLIGQAGDDLLRMILFWAIFLPWGRFYSQDAKRANNLHPENLHFSAASAAFIVQIMLVYVCTALLKNSPEWHTTGTALYYALSLDQVLMPGGKLIYPYSGLLHFLTLSTYYIELYLPFVLLIPFYTSFFRLLVVGVLTGFHLGISVTLFVGLFYLINLVSFIGLLPAPALNWFDAKLLPHIQNLGYRLRRFSFNIKNPIQLRFNWQLPAARKAILIIVKEGFVISVLLYVIWWNFSNVPQINHPMPVSVRWPGMLLRVDQHWGMFAPEVFKDDGWYILEGVTATHKHIDLNRNGQPVTERKPESVVALFKNDRWRKYGENYLFVNNAFMRPYFCHYRLRIWNEAHRPEDKVSELQVIYMKERTLPNYQPVKPKREVLCTCSL